ncbi:hypothetical protein [Lactobacillus rhamnosus DSM 14870] [Lacticaseibacillus rhamnosus]|nr:hypothetical protein [Lactobacillus rhamnosus DSM 14870] [Lacticaseibacillus rhamnosus]
MNDNLLHQQFDAQEPFAVLHTDVTQVRLLDHSWGYISAIIDEASRELSLIHISEPTRPRLISYAVFCLKKKKKKK